MKRLVCYFILLRIQMLYLLSNKKGWPILGYCFLVFTKSVDSNFCMFWLAPGTWNFLGYSLFCEWREKCHVVSWKFQKKKLWPLIKRHFYIHLIWKILKQLSPSGPVKSSGYIPQRFASRYNYNLHYYSPPLRGDSCIVFFQVAA